MSAVSAFKRGGWRWWAGGGGRRPVGREHWGHPTLGREAPRHMLRGLGGIGFCVARSLQPSRTSMPAKNTVARCPKEGGPLLGAMRDRGRQPIGVCAGEGVPRRRHAGARWQSAALLSLATCPPQASDLQKCFAGRACTGRQTRAKHSACIRCRGGRRAAPKAGPPARRHIRDWSEQRGAALLQKRTGERRDGEGGQKEEVSIVRGAQARHALAAGAARGGSGPRTQRRQAAVNTPGGLAGWRAGWPSVRAGPHARGRGGSSAPSQRPCSAC